MEMSYLSRTRKISVGYVLVPAGVANSARKYS